MAVFVNVVIANTAASMSCRVDEHSSIVDLIALAVPVGSSLCLCVVDGENMAGRILLGYSGDGLNEDFVGRGRLVVQPISRNSNEVRRRVLEVGLMLIVCLLAAWAFIPRYPQPSGRACGSPALDSLQKTGNMERRSAEIMGGEDGRRFLCKEDGRRKLIEGAGAAVVALTLLAGVLSAVDLNEARRSL